MRRTSCAVIAAACIVVSDSGLVEEERLNEYAARNHTWPTAYLPDTPGWKKINDRRFMQVGRIDQDSNSRYNGYVEATRSGITTPNFTETGWGLARAPSGLVNELREAVRTGLAEGKQRLEHEVEVIEGPRAWFISRPDLMKRVLEELRPMHEQWSGQKLVGNNAYGLRLYRNESALFMHVDKPDTHIISSIMHVDRSEDSEPWPILIEDYHGNTNEVILESGDLLFYESSKCFHGRPKKFIGSWYTSVFTHYYPVGWDKPKRRLDAHYAVPPHWREVMESKPGGCSDSDVRCPSWADEGECAANTRWMLSNCRKSCGSCLPGVDEANLDRLEMAGTGIKEPGCKHDWCGFRDGTVKWFGPGEDGMVITTGSKYRLWDEQEHSEL